MDQNFHQVYFSQTEKPTIHDLWQDLTEADSEMLKGGLLTTVQTVQESLSTTRSEATDHTISICRGNLCGGPPA